MICKCTTLGLRTCLQAKKPTNQRKETNSPYMQVAGTHINDITGKQSNDASQSVDFIRQVKMTTCTLPSAIDAMTKVDDQTGTAEESEYTGLEPI
jgi:hypothetical protein